MNFYFCEKCGKRITDQEVAAGQAVDKRLRGVYCKNCAVGVLTMNDLPAITDAEINQHRAGVHKVAEVSGRRGQSASRFPAQPGTAHPAAVDTPATGNFKISARLHGHPEQTNHWIWVAVGVAALAIALIWLGVAGRSSARVAERHNPDKATATDSTPVPPPRLALPPPKPVEPGPLPNPPRKDAPAVDRPKAPDGQAAPNLTTLLRFEGLAENDLEGRVARLRDYLDRNSDSPDARRAATVLSDLQSRIALSVALIKTDVKPDPPPAQTVPKDAPPKPPVPPAGKEEPPVAPQPSKPVATKDGYTDWLRISFADGQMHGVMEDGSVIDMADAEGKRCLRVRPGQWGFRVWNRLNVEGQGMRLRVHYFAHNCKGVSVSLMLNPSGPQSRRTAKAADFVSDKWATAEFIPQQFNAAGNIVHAEYGGIANGADPYLLIDEIVWEKK